jgi:2-dehydro-3-deoxygluconokinase
MKFLRQQGVGVDHVFYGHERLGLFFLEAGAAQRGSKVIYDRGCSSFALLEPAMVDWPRILAGARWFHSTGITPAVARGSGETCVAGMAAAKSLGLRVSCDLNYRANLWKWGKSAGEVMPNLVTHCDVIIGNEEDAQKVFGITAPDVDVNRGKVSAEKYVTVCEELVRRFPHVSTVAITLRGSLSASHNTWSAVLWNDGAMYFAPTYDIWPIVDRVGGGDSFAAALIYGLGVTHRDPQTALNFAVAASCLKHSIRGDVNLISVAEVEALAAGNVAGRVAR